MVASCGNWAAIAFSDIRKVVTWRNEVVAERVFEEGEKAEKGENCGEGVKALMPRVTLVPAEEIDEATAGGRMLVVQAHSQTAINALRDLGNGMLGNLEAHARTVQSPCCPRLDGLPLPRSARCRDE